MANSIDSEKLSQLRNIWERRVFRQRYTFLVSLPHDFIKTLGPDPKTILMILQKDGSLKLTAIPDKDYSKKVVKNA